MVVRRIRIKSGAIFVFSRFAAGVGWLAGMRTGGALEKLGVRNEE